MWSYCAHMHWNAACWVSFVAPHGTALGYSFWIAVLMLARMTGILQKTAIKSVPPMYRTFSLPSGVSRPQSQFFRNGRSAIQYRAGLIVDCLLTPNRIQPVPYDLIVGLTKKFLHDVALSPQMGIHRVIEATGSNLDFRNRLAKAFAQAHSLLLLCHAVRVATLSSSIEPFGRTRQACA